LISAAVRLSAPAVSVPRLIGRAAVSVVSVTTGAVIGAPMFIESEVSVTPPKVLDTGAATLAEPPVIVTPEGADNAH